MQRAGELQYLYWPPTDKLVCGHVASWVGNVGQVQTSKIQRDSSTRRAGDTYGVSVGRCRAETVCVASANMVPGLECHPP